MKKDLLNFLTVLSFTLIFGTSVFLKSNSNYRKIDELEKQIENIINKTEKIEERISFSSDDLREIQEGRGFITD